LRTVGVILVVAMLITPAATALLLYDDLRKVIIVSSIIGLLSAILGFITAVLLGTTPGPAMTLVATSFYLIAAIFSPSKGLLFKTLDRNKQTKRIVKEDILRQLIKSDSLSFDAPFLQDKLGLTKRKITTGIQGLKKLRLVTMAGNQVKLTKLGEAGALRLVRAHRLWETYQVDKMGLAANQIHEEADFLEHHLSDEFLEELEKDLGFPDKDPHGSPIPSK